MYHRRTDGGLAEVIAHGGVGNWAGGHNTSWCCCCYAIATVTAHGSTVSNGGMPCCGIVLEGHLLLMMLLLLVLQLLSLHLHPLPFQFLLFQPLFLLYQPLRLFFLLMLQAFLDGDLGTTIEYRGG